MRLKFLFAVLTALLFVAPACAAGSFANWTAIVVAGDYHAHSGADSEVFDNARRDISTDLVKIGFSPSNIAQFSVRPENYPMQQPHPSNKQSIGNTLWDMSNRADGGCLAYFTSHGNTDGIVVGDTMLSPKEMETMLDNSCGGKPTVIVISACFSGTFVDQYVPALQQPNHFVFTAARPDRTSFGCGETERYTFFDTCMLQSLPGSGNFPALAKNVIACVSAREKKEGVAYPSEPQVSVGAAVMGSLPTWK